MATAVTDSTSPRLATSPVVPSIRPRAAPNCVGTPCGNNQNAFFDSNFFGAVFASTADFGQPYDFSMGVNGTVGGGGGGANLVSAASRLTHSAAGTFDINMPLTGPSGVEDRDPNRGSGNYEAVFTFDTAVPSGDVSVVSATATVGTPTFSGNEIQVPLTGVANAQIVTLRVENVNGSGTVAGDVPFGFLIGDIDSSRTVDSGDKAALQAVFGQPVDGSNFRAGTNPGGRFNRKDRVDIKTHFGTSIP